jgi:DNA repair protein RecO (recombination protein O)
VKKVGKGLIIKRFSYSETSLIVHCFTEDVGLKSFLFQGAKKKKGLVLIPLSPIEFTYYQKEDGQLAKMTDAILCQPFASIPFNPIKSTVLFFQVEILSYVLHEGVPDKHLYSFLVEELTWLDENDSLANYPIYWLLELSQQLGFYPLKQEANTQFFDLENGEFVNFQPSSFKYRQGEDVQYLFQLVNLDKTASLHFAIPKSSRQKVLQLLLDYFKIHIPNFNPSSALEVIQSIWE